MEASINSKCCYTGVTGRCNDSVLAGSSFCFWHDENVDKNTTDIAKKLEARAKTGHPMDGFILKKANLTNINLTNKNMKYQLINSNLCRADLTGAHLYDLCLSGSNLLKVNFTNANLNQADLSNCNLLGVNFNNARMEFITWGKYLQQELLAKKDPKNAKSLYREAEETARTLKKFLETKQLNNIAQDFFYKEMCMHRKQMPKLSFKRFISWVIDCVSGYGEHPHKFLLFALATLIFFGCLYFFAGIKHSGEIIAYRWQDDYKTHLTKLAECIYFSAVTFTTLGYGDMIPHGMAKIFAAIESIIGNLSLALFVVLCFKKMNR